MECLIPGLIGLGVLALIVVVAIFSSIAAKKRTEALKQVADELGLAFYPEGNPALVPELAVLELFNQGRSRKTKNMIHGLTEETEVAILDYQYTTGAGKHSHTFNQTVIAFRSTELDLPPFAMRPENLFDKLGGLFGSQDIDFDAHPLFSKSFLLRGQPEERVRALFDPTVIAFFEARLGVSVEGNGQRLIFYRASQRPKPEQVRGLFQEAFEAFALFKRRS